MSNKAELLKKIKALADRGVDGERESAQTLLARLMEQYGISERRGTPRNGVVPVQSRNRTPLAEPDYLHGNGKIGLRLRRIV